MALEPTDNYIVERDETFYSVQHRILTKQMEDTDLLAVGRGDTNYRVTWAEIKDDLSGGGSIPDAYPSPDQITATPDFQGGTGTEQDPYILKTVVCNTAGTSVQTEELITIDVGGEGLQVVNFEVVSGDDGERWEQEPKVTSNVGVWTGRLDYKDNPESTVDKSYTATFLIGTTYFKWTVDQKLLVEVGPEIDSITLVESNPEEDPRFTDQEFVATVNMTEEGVPVSNKVIDAFVEGTIKETVQFKEPLESSNSSTEPQYADRGNFTFIAGAAGNGYNFGYNDGSIEKGFDGIVDNSNLGFFNGQYPNVNPNTEKWYFTFPDPIVSPGKVEVYWRVTTDNSKQHYLIINGVTTSVDMTAWSNSQTGGKGWQDITQYINDAGGTLRSLGMQTTTVNQPTRNENWSAIRVDGKILISEGENTNLVFASGTDMTHLESGDQILQNTTSGFVGSIDGTTVTLSSGDTDWTDGEEVTGPEKTIETDNTKKYLKFDSNGNVSDLLSSPQDPQYVTDETAASITFKFPSTFPSGNTPDEELGKGTTLTVDAYAYNSKDSTGHVQATVQPEGAGGGFNLAGMTTLYNGGGSGNTDLNIVTGIDMIENEALLWIKSRDNGENHMLFDTIRGKTNSLNSNTDFSEADGSPLQSFNDNGFTVTYSGGIWFANQYVAWTFQSAPGYFDVVKYTGNGGGQQISHNLGIKPGFVITKATSQQSNWNCAHVSQSDGSTLYLNEGNMEVGWSGSVLPNTAFTDTQFQVSTGSAPGGSPGNTNLDGVEYIAYVFAEDGDNIKCGSYTGNGSATGPVITTGFEPQWVMVKRIDGGGSANWSIFDSKRGFSSATGVSDGKLLWANATSNDMDDKTIVALSNGFQIADNGGTINTDGATHVYVAIKAPETSSLTQEEFSEQALKFGTYDHRKHVYCAEQAEAERDALITYMAQQGYSLDDILKYV